MSRSISGKILTCYLWLLLVGVFLISQTQYLAHKKVDEKNWAVLVADSECEKQHRSRRCAFHLSTRSRQNC